MRVLYDTMIWVHACVIPAEGAEQGKALHEMADRLIGGADGEGVEICVAAQNLLEIYSVLTGRVGPRWIPDDAALVVRRIMDNAGVEVLTPTAEALAYAQRMTSSVQPRGGEVFDLYLAGTMFCNGVLTIYTRDAGHFAGLPGITAIDPFQNI